MSSRALRKAQKEREKLQLAEQAEHEAEDDSESEHDLPKSTAKPSMFAMLKEDEDEDENNDDGTIENNQDKDVQSTDEDENQDTVNQSTNSTPKTSTKRKKKKKKAKGKNTEAIKTTKTSQEVPGSLDEIDLALKSLSMTGGTTKEIFSAKPPNPAASEVCELLRIDTQHLQVGNEMKRLFGRAAFEVDREDEAAAAPSRHRLEHAEGATLAEAVKGKNSSGGAGLPAVLRRRNIFVAGKEEWPRATGGGLRMEIVDPQFDGGAVQYSFVHNSVYQHAQKEFETCVMAMDPTRMVHLLRFNPYHISTLLQVSEIAKHEKDYATSGDLLERALFSFGRAVHPTFATNLAQGKARLDFRRSENREFWLACWRYIANISMRATWRTAYEWARLILSLDPQGDPYCVSLLIDQLALRAKQPESFMKLVNSNQFIFAWSCDANIMFSRCLATSMQDNTTPRAKQMLSETIERFPWVAARLYQELNLDKLPKSIWGRKALSSVDELQSELYVTTAIDLWKQPDNLALLISAAAVAASVPEEFSMAVQHRDINLNEARFVILTDKPALIGLLPHSITSTVDSMSDPLPPGDAISTYDTGVSRNNRTLGEDLASRLPADDLIHSDPQQFIEEIHTFQRFFELLIPTLPTNGGEVEITDELVEQAIRRSNLTVQEMRACMTRLISLRTALVAQPGQRVRNVETGDEVQMQADGVVRATLHRTRGGGSRASRDPAEIDADEELVRQLMEEEYHDAEEVQRDAEGDGRF